MFAAGAAVLWVGYTLTWWGWMRLGGPIDLLDLVVPGRTPPTRGVPNASSPSGAGGGFSTGGGGAGAGGGGGGW